MSIQRDEDHVNDETEDWDSRLPCVELLYRIRTIHWIDRKEIREALGDRDSRLPSEEPFASQVATSVEDTVVKHCRNI